MHDRAVLPRLLEAGSAARRAALAALLACVLALLTAWQPAAGLASESSASSADSSVAASATDLSATADTPVATDSADAPDYSDASNWAYWADVAEPTSLGDADMDNTASNTSNTSDNTSSSTADGDTEDALSKQADLFIVCPTVSMGSDGSTNMDLTDEDDRASFVGALNMELGIYDEYCTVYAPFYRQATLSTYTADAEVSDAALELAYEDVRAAFEYYLERNPDGPIVLAGFSQGADMVIRLIKDYFDDEELQGRLVAAYAIGWRLTQEECDEYPWLQAAQGEDDTGVVITFSSEAESVTDSLIVPEGTTTLSINPLSWTTTSEVASADLNLGACFTNYDGEITEEIAGLCGAYIDPERGTLKVTGIDAADYPSGLDIFAEGVYHLYDYQFFYRNLQENVGVRLAAYLAAQE